MFAQRYADDGAILVCDKFLTTLCSVMQRIISGVDKEQSVNPSKTEMALFIRRYKVEQLKLITFFACLLYTSDAADE